MALLKGALAIVLGACALVFAAVAWRMLTYPHEVVVTEGAIGLAVLSILDGVPLYAPSRWLAPPFVIVHYTPLYYLVVAAVTALCGPGFLAGRMVSTLATLGTAALAGRMARTASGRTAPAWTAAGLWLSSWMVVFWGTVQRVDALAILLEAAGCLVFLSARRRGRIGWGALPWFLAAWCTKQVMVVGLLAATADLFFTERRAAARFGALGLGAIAALLAGLTWWSHGGFFTAAVLGTVSAKADTPWVVLSNARLFFGSPWNMLLLLLATWGAYVGRGRPFLGCYLGMGMVLAILTDANIPRFFPPILAASVLVAILIDRVRGSRRDTMGVLFALVLTGGVHLVYEMRPLVRERVVGLHADNERLTVLAEAVRRHTTGRGPVLAQDVGMLLSAGRPVTVADPYVFSILAGNGAWRPEHLIAGIRQRRFEAVVLNRPLEKIDGREWTTLWIAPARDALREHYRLAEAVGLHDQHWWALEPERYIYVRREDPP